ncbi:MAG: hypothetical protein NT120_00735 [Candidatus Aenigmarchaeota archaeon]|nr:hypothetical protein [Candidatus Aenigmarchaeota archaeon]
MEIRETLFTKSFSMETDNPHGLALEFMKKLSHNYMVYEKKNKFQTDGPVKKITILFDVVEVLDKFSSIIVTFSMEAENNTMYIDIEGSFLMRVRESGFFSSVFSEFYLDSIFPVLKKVSQDHIKALEKEIEAL